MGSPISSTVASLFMENFEMKAINTTANSPRLWRRYVNDIFVVKMSAHKSKFLQHINSVNHSIKFTVEDTRSDSSMPFLDTLVMPQPSGTLATTVSMKPMHTDQYLQWDSHHTISVKYSAVSTLIHRAKAVCLHLQLLQQEENTHKKCC